MAQRRITDAAATPQARAGARALRASGTCRGDTDLAWSRITLWRGLLAAALDQPRTSRSRPRDGDRRQRQPQRGADGGVARPVTLRCPVTRTRTEPGTGLISVVAGARVAARSSWCGPTAASPPSPSPASRSGASRCRRATTADCLAEELRRLDPDEIYAEVLTEGFKLLHEVGDEDGPCRRLARRQADDARRARRRSANDAPAAHRHVAADDAPAGPAS